MSEYNFYHPTEIRYGDLDPQGHVNNAKYLTYFEHARTYYFLELGLIKKGQSFLDVGIILADVRITFHTSIVWENQIKVGARVKKLGNKSMILEQCVTDADNGTSYATGELVLVAYDYHTSQTIIIPDKWRKIISDFERI